MKVVLISSRVTYLRGNGARLFEACRAVPGVTLAGLVLSDNRGLRLTLRAALVAGAGARRIGATLLRNELRPDPRLMAARRTGLPAILAADIQDPGSVERIRALRPDLIVHTRTRTILRPELLRLAPLGCVNVHHGLLPEMRGTFCDLRQLVRGEAAGFSLHRMTARVDQGAILIREVVASPEQCGRDYPRYLELSEAREASALRALLQESARRGVLPPEAVPQGHGVWNRRPTLAEIRHWRREGWSL
jgi:methionyl-tRNA formyltransferase